MSPNQPTHNPWTNRFAQPDEQSLLAALPEEPREFTERLLGVWAGRDTWSRSLAWRGWGWNWAICFTPAGGGTIEAAIICDPERPRASVRLQSEDFAKLQQQNGFKPVRTQLLSAKPVGPLVWTEWPLDNLRVVEWLESLTPSDP